MLPCSEMGGDYYDVRRTVDGCWLGIGDIAGHGVSAGLVMLMVQSITAALTARDSDATPAQILVQTNRILHDNIRARMARDEHITMTLLRFHADGRVVFAGAHEDLLLLRARTGVCERIETEGAWLGVMAEIGASTPDQELRLEPGDVLLLYTDGLTEAVGEDREMFGIDRLCAALEAARGGSAPQVLDALLASLHAFCGAPTDDVAALVLRYAGPCGA
jgi:serine phosphatase RsbU (regulator of sigma subunit)